MQGSSDRDQRVRQAEGAGFTAAVVPVYMAKPQAPGPRPVVLVVQEIFGLHEHNSRLTGKDESIPLSTVESMRDALIAAGCPSDIHVYEDAPHAFHADYRPSYRAEAAADGWARTLGWFKSHGVSNV